MNNYRWISFQSLIGGLSIATEQSLGKGPLAEIDYEGVINSNLYVNYQRTIKNNYFPHLILKGNLTSKSEEFLTEEDRNQFNHLLNSKIDLVSAVPICSGLSMANSSPERGEMAKQNNNLLGITEFTLKQIQPMVYIFENAPALYTSKNDSLRNLLYQLSKKYQYGITFVKTNTLLHGLPQNRQRTFVLFWKGGNCPEINFLPKKHPNVFQLLENIPKDLTGQESLLDYQFNPWIRYLESEVPNWRQNTDCRWPMLYVYKNKTYKNLKKYGDDRFKKSIDRAKEKLESGRGIMLSMPICTEPNQVNTIYAKSIPWFLHPTENRGFTLRECMRLMGMPDDFPISIKDYGKIGQNVPVNTAKDFIDICRGFIDNQLKFKNTDFDMIDFTKVEQRLPKLF